MYIGWAGFPPVLDVGIPAPCSVAVTTFKPTFGSSCSLGFISRFLDSSDFALDLYIMLVAEGQCLTFWTQRRSPGRTP